jgi:preprotein translocase subunit SecD
MNRYPLWKNLLVLIIVLWGLLYALPNIFDQNPSIEISGTREVQVDATTADKIKQALQDANVPFRAVQKEGEKKLLVRFEDSDTQLQGKEALQLAFEGKYVQALTLSPDLPGWVRSLGLDPMYLGLDLRGGVHVLIDVDMESAIAKAVEGYYGEIRIEMRKEKLRYTSISQEPNGVKLLFGDAQQAEKAAELLGNRYRELEIKTDDGDEGYKVVALLGEVRQKEIKKETIDQNTKTLRKRVNALGVTEPLIQRQGDRRIVVQLPGARDPGVLMKILESTATLEYRLEDTKHSVQDALAGRVPAGSKLYYMRDGRPVLLKKQVIVTGEHIKDASSGFDSRSGTPMVRVTLDGKGGDRMRDITTENVGQPMAVVFIERRTETRNVDGKLVKRKVLDEKVISLANIREPFGRNFQTTGLDSPAEARELALLLRAGALKAPIEIVEERTIGPSLGQESIDQGFKSVMIGMLLVMIFMAIYYRVFGLVANLALMMNLVLIVALLSWLQATLTLPGIAGIVLTVGMAVDANVLIFERIREEIRIGNTPQASIHAGYEKALSTIVDANITTFIAAVVLYSFGTGPIKGFAVTLALGIATSLFTALLGTRAVVNLIYGRRRVEKLAI